MKDCFIEYDNSAVNLTSKVCRKPLVMTCDAAISEDVCMTLYETECITRERVGQVRMLAKKVKHRNILLFR